MDYALLAFCAFAAAAVMSAVAVISVRNMVQAALFLVLTFFTVACTWILAGAEFLGIALVLVYVGAVMVLFLFVVMMLDIDLFKCIFCGFCEESCPVDSIVESHILEYHMEKRGENILTKPQLLALGDRLEAGIAERRAVDAPYR
jgi:hypothetical protein